MAPGAYAGAFGLFALGFVFLIDLSFSVNQSKLTLTPDFVAFALFYAGISRIRDIMPKTDWLEPLLVAMGVLSGIEFLADLFGVSAFLANQADPEVLNMMPLVLLFSILSVLATVAVVWRICGTIRDFALRRGHHGLARMAHGRRMLYLGYTIVIHLLTLPLLLLNIQLGPMAFSAFLLFFLAGLVVIALLVHLALRAKETAARTMTGVPPDTGCPPYPVSPPGDDRPTPHGTQESNV